MYLPATSQVPGCLRALSERPTDLGAHRLLQKVAQVVVSYVRRLRGELEREEGESEVLDGLAESGRGAGMGRGAGEVVGRARGMHA